MTNTPEDHNRKRHGLFRRRQRPLNEKRIYRHMTLAEAEVAEKQHRRVMAVLTGLLTAQFVAMTSNTIIGNAMPVIVAEIGGTPSQYTWIITSAILANTVMTPIAGKLADLFDKRLMFMIFIGIFTLGSLLSGLAVSAEMLIAVRILQGIGMGGQVMLSMVIIATIIPPRQRGRYNGYQGAVMAVATVSGPFLGGIIVDTLGWRWCFLITIPFMIFAAAISARRLDLPYRKPKTIHLDIAGAVLITITACTFLIWMSMGGSAFAWNSLLSYVMIAVSLMGAVLFVVVERTAKEPLIPLHILGSRTTILAIIVSLGVGSAMFATNVFLGQYFQYGRGYSPVIAGALGLPIILGILISVTWSGRVVTKWGTWKRVVVIGVALMTIGAGLMATIDQTTPLALTSLYLFVLGWGLGMCLQNIVLAVQNTVGLANTGAATSSVTFFRNLGGATSIQLFGLLYAGFVTARISRELGVDQATADLDSLDLAALPDSIENVVRAAYGDGIAVVFIAITIMGLLGLLAAAFIPPSNLRSTMDMSDKVRQTLDDSAEESESVNGDSTTGPTQQSTGGEDPDETVPDHESRRESPPGSGPS